MWIYSHNPNSESAKALKEALGIRKIKNEGSKFKGKQDKLVINWGSSNPIEEVTRCSILNNPRAIKKAVNKLEAFKTLSEGVDIPEWTESQQEAAKWLAEGCTVVARTVVEGFGGEGIVLVENGTELPVAPLYTKYIPKTEEYRVHVFKDEAFFVQRKARKKEVPDEQINWKIRNLAGGFIFANQDVDAPEAAKKAAVNAVALLGLDFGAVDIIWNKKRDKYYTLEVNTAPGLAGATLEKYAEQFRKMK